MFVKVLTREVKSTNAFGDFEKVVFAFSRFVRKNLRGR